MHRSFERLQSISRPVLSLVVSLERRGGGEGGGAGRHGTTQSVDIVEVL